MCATKKDRRSINSTHWLPAPPKSNLCTSPQCPQCAFIPRARSATRVPSQCSIRIQILSSCQFWKHIPSSKVWESDQTQGIIVPTHILTYMDSGFLRMKITSHSKLCCYQRRPMLPSILCKERIWKSAIRWIRAACIGLTGHNKIIYIRNIINI